MKYHPDYDYSPKFRLAYNGGWDFINEYLVRFSKREDLDDYAERKQVTYCPAHAKAAIQDIKNAIFQRFVDIKRMGGSKTWQYACENDVDFNGNSMSSFIGRLVLPELLPMGKVGIFIDKPRLSARTKFEAKDIRPYLYVYKTEQILNWTYDDNKQLIYLLLSDDVPTIEQTIITNYTKRYREIRLVDGHVTIKIMDSEAKTLQEVELNISRIPFVIASISEPLMKDIADYQIALLNLGSSDMSYALKSNFPFYVEQYNPTHQLMQKTLNTEPTEEEITVGVTTGRKYPVGAERPAFIHPSSEPLKISMEKQDRLIQEIRQIVNLAVSNIAPQRASAESKKEDTKSLEAGLSYIGLELQYVELEIARIWNLYEDVADEPIVKYPTNYSIRNDADRRAEAKELSDLRADLPSITFQKEISKQIASTLLSTKTSFEILNKIYEEIDAAQVIVTDHETLRQDAEAAFISKEFASVTAGYPAGEAAKAEEDHARRAARLIMAQKAAGGNMAARGADDLAVEPGAEATDEKSQSQDRDLNPDDEKKVKK